MDRDGFLETLKSYYRDEIQEAYRQCQMRNGHDMKIDLLREILSRLQISAMRDGITEESFQELVEALYPGIRELLNPNNVVELFPIVDEVVSDKKKSA